MPVLFRVECGARKIFQRLFVFGRLRGIRILKRFVWFYGHLEIPGSSSWPSNSKDCEKKTGGCWEDASKGFPAQTHRNSWDLFTAFGSFIDIDRHLEEAGN
ncbi:hypothetical protein BaRGS_00029067, partial [Batillaria attramentaria]